MNKIYRTVYNETTNTWVAVEETAKSHRKSSGGVVDCTQPESTRHSGSLKLRGLTAAVAIALLSPLAVSPAFAADWNGGSENVVTSSNSNASGQDNKVSGIDSFASGKNNIASGDYSTVVGDSNKAGGTNSVSLGGRYNQSTAHGSATLGGEKNNAGAEYSATVGGYKNTAASQSAVAWGREAFAGSMTADAAWLEQKYNPDGTLSLAETINAACADLGGGNSCKRKTTLDEVIAWYNDENSSDDDPTPFQTKYNKGVSGKGENATAWGFKTVAGNDQATAFGENSIANGVNSTAFGKDSYAYADNSLAALGGKVGDKNTADNTHHSDTGVNSVAIGNGAWATHDDSIALGTNAVADEGNKSASGGGRHGNVAIGANTHAEGAGTVAIGGMVGESKGGAYANNEGSIAIGSKAEAVGAILTLGGSYGTTTSKGTDSEYARQLGNFKYANGNLVLDDNGNPVIEVPSYGNNLKPSQMIAIGDSAAAYGDQSTALGANSIAAGVSSIAIGGDDLGRGTAKAHFKNVQNLLGNGKDLDGDGEIKGNERGLSKELTDNGYDVPETLEHTLDGRTVGNGGQAFADTTLAKGDASIAFGQKAVAGGHLSNAVGAMARTVGNNSNAIGTASVAGADNSIAMGSVATTGEDAERSTAIGYMAQTGGKVNVAEVDSVQGMTYSVNGGAEQKVTDLGSQSGNGVNSVAVGVQNKVLGSNSTAVGQGNIVLGNRSGAFGDPTIITGNYSYSLGHDNVIATDKTFVLGGKVTKTATNSVFLGEDTAYVNNGTTKGSGGYTDNYTIGGAEYKNDFKAQSSVGVVSVGDTGKERRIQNVAAGWVDKDSTDVINGSQLNAAYEDLQWRASVDANGGKVSSQVDPQVIGDYKDTKNKGNVNFYAGDGIEIETANANSLDMTFKVNKADPHSVNGGAIKAPTVTTGGSQYWDATQTANAINASYWIASDRKTTKNVSPSNQVNWVGQNGATVTLSGDTFTVELDKDYLPTVSEGKNTKVTKETGGNHINYVVDAVDTIVEAGTGVKVEGGKINSETNQRTYTVSNAWTVTQDADGNTTINDGTNDYTITKAAKTTLTANNGEEPNKTKGNITLTQDGDNYDVALNNNVKLGDDKEAGSLNVSDKKDGDNPVANTEIKPNEINFTDAGDNNTGVITGLAPNFTETDATTTTAPAAPTNINNAATVGDVLNAGWNLQAEGKAVDFVTHGDTVNFASSDKSVTITGTTASTIDFVVNKAENHEENANGSISAPTPTAGDDGKTPTQFWDATQTANAINAAAWRVTSSTAGEDIQKVAAGDLVDLKAGTGITIKQDARDFTFSTNFKQDGSNIEVKDNADGSQTISYTGNDSDTITTLTANNGEEPNKTKGNITLTQDGDNYDVALNNNVKLGDDKAAGSLNVSDKKDGDNPVANTEIKPNEINFTDGGDNNTGKITGLGSHLADAGDNKTMPADSAPDKWVKNKNDAATLGDVLNAGWNLQAEGKAVDFVTHGDTVNFASSNKTVTITDKSADGKDIIDFVVNTDGKTIKPDENGKLSVQTDGDTIIAGDNGLKVNTGGSQVGDNGKAVPKDGDTNKVATVGDITNTINGVFWKADASGNGTNDAEANKVKAGHQVNFVGGAGVAIDQVNATDSTTFTFRVDDTTLKGTNPLEFTGDDPDAGKLTPEHGGMVQIKGGATDGTAAAEDGAPADASGKNITVNPSSDGKALEVALAPNVDLGDKGSLKVGKDGDNVTNITPEGMNVANKDGNNTNIAPNNITFGDKDGNPSNTASIIGLASHLQDPTGKTENPDKTGKAYDDMKNQAATVGDVLNAGWNLQAESEPVDFVTHGDTVNFASSDKSVTITGTTGSTIDFVVNKAENHKANDNGTVSAPTPTAGDDGKTPTQFWDATQTANAINAAAWRVTSSTAGKDIQKVAAGDLVDLKAGTGITIEQDGKNFTFSTNLKGENGIEITDNGDGSQTIKYTGKGDGNRKTTVTNTDGNLVVTPNLKDDNNHIYDVALNNTITVGNEKDGDQPITIDGTTGDITLGGDTGGNINNVANHINPDGTMIDDKAPTNQAATVQDVLNSGWNVKVGNADPEYIKHGDQVAFIDGKGTKVSGSKDGIAYDINVDENSPLSINKDGALTVNVGGFDNTTDGSVKANNPNGLATAGDVANAVNNSGWNVTTSASTGEVSGTSKELIKPTNTVTFDAGDNIRIVQSGNQISVGTTRNINVAGNLNVAGDTTVGNLAVNPGSNVDMGGNQIHNVADGTKPNDAVNVSQLRDAINWEPRVNQVENHANAGTAQAIATAGLPQVYLPGKNLIAIGGGVYRGESGYAVGFSSISDNGSWIFKATGSGNSRGNFGGSAAVGYQW